MQVADKTNKEQNSHTVKAGRERSAGREQHAWGVALTIWQVVISGQWSGEIKWHSQASEQRQQERLAKSK